MALCTVRYLAKKPVFEGWGCYVLENYNNISTNYDLCGYNKLWQVYKVENSKAAKHVGS